MHCAYWLMGNISGGTVITKFRSRIWTGLAFAGFMMGIWAEFDSANVAYVKGVTINLLWNKDEVAEVCTRILKLIFLTQYDQIFTIITLMSDHEKKNYSTICCHFSISMVEGFTNIHVCNVHETIYHNALWRYSLLLHIVYHYSDVIMGTMASQVANLIIVYSTVYPGADQWKHQSSASLVYVRGIQRWPVNSSHKGPVTRKMFPFDDNIIHDRLLRNIPNPCERTQALTGIILLHHGTA